GPAPGLGLGVELLRLLHRDGEQLLLGLQRAGVAALLQVGAVATVLGGDLGAVLGRAHHARQAQQLQRVLEVTVDRSMDFSRDAVRGLGRLDFGVLSSGSWGSTSVM